MLIIADNEKIWKETEIITFIFLPKKWTAKKKKRPSPQFSCWPWKSRFITASLSLLKYTCYDYKLKNPLLRFEFKEFN